MAGSMRSAIWAALACLLFAMGSGPAARPRTATGPVAREGAMPAPGRTPGQAPAPEQSSAPGLVQVYAHPDPSGPIADRAAWARREAKANGWTGEFWLGFGIRRLMGEHSWIGWHPWGGADRRLTLDDLIHGRKTPLEKRAALDQAVRGTAAAMPETSRPAGVRLDGEPERLALKTVAILLRLSISNTDFPAGIRVSNLDLPFDFQGLPFVWVGPAEDSESLAYLMPLYAGAAAEADKLSVLRAIGLHRNAAAVVPFVERILAGRESEEIREEAAACLGEQNDPRALELLLKTIKIDPSEEVREEAVQALVELELPAAADALVSLALTGADRHIRGDAVDGLAEKATAAAVKTLEKIAAGDKDPEIQAEAIQALAELPRQGGLTFLVDLARSHEDGWVRVEAVEAIGEIGSAEAVKILTELARGNRR